MTLGYAIEELERIVSSYGFKTKNGEGIPSPVITALIAKHNGERWELTARRIEKNEITPEEYLKEMIEMLELWMRKRFVSSVLSKFSSMETQDDHPM